MGRVQDDLGKYLVSHYSSIIATIWHTLERLLIHLELTSEWRIGDRSHPSVILAESLAKQRQLVVVPLRGVSREGPPSQCGLLRDSMRIARIPRVPTGMNRVGEVVRNLLRAVE